MHHKSKVLECLALVQILVSGRQRVYNAIDYGYTILFLLVYFS